MSWFNSSDVIVTAGSRVVQVNDGANTSFIYPRDAFVFGDSNPVEVLSVSATDITLVDVWSEGSGTGSAYVIPTAGDFTKATKEIRSANEAFQSNIDAIEAWGTDMGSVSFTDHSEGVHTARTMQQMDADVQAIEDNANLLVGNIRAMTKAEFFALAEQRKAGDAGRFSGFFEWGKHHDDLNYAPINNGLYARTNTASWANQLAIGGNEGNSPTGSSLTNNPRACINGVLSKIAGYTYAINNNTTAIKFPPAPDGTETYDSATGAYVQHASSALAFASETATNKVIITRQDYAFIEQFHEKLSEHDVFCPLGNTQYGSASFDGLALSNNIIAQGYSAFGDWDTETKGYHKRWSSMTDAEKVKAIQNPDNNIYSDDGELIQVKYRVRVVKGMGDDWDNITPNQDGLGAAMRYSGVGDLSVTVRGNRTTSTDYGRFGNADAGRYHDQWEAPMPQLGMYRAASPTGAFDELSSTAAHNGLCFAIPVALVQRRNQGAYHPTWNPEGCSPIGQIENNHNGKWTQWNSALISTARCFEFRDVSSNADGADGIGYPSSYLGSPWGRIGGDSRHKGGLFYDAIYADDVQDLRMSSRKLPKAEIRKKYKRMAIAGEQRGFEGVPFMKAYISGEARVDTSSTWAKFDYSSILGSTDFSTEPVQDKVHLGKALHSSGVVLDVTTVYNAGSQLWLAFANQGMPSGGTWSAVFGDYQTSKSAKPTWTDIIGDPANIAATFPNGVEGAWVPDMTPVGDRLLNRKSLDTGTLDIEWTADSGSSWSAGAQGMNSTANSLDSWALTNTALVHYQTQAHFTEEDDNSEVLDLGGVFATSSSLITDGGNLLTSSCIGKVGTNALDTQYSYIDGLIQYSIAGSIGDKIIAGSSNYPLIHVGVALSHSNNSPAVKTLDYLSSENSVAKLMYAAKEMVWDDGAATAGDFETKDGNSAATYTSGVTYRILGGTFSHRVFTCKQSGTYTVNGGFTELPDGSLLHLSTGVTHFTAWDGNGWGDNNRFEIVDGSSTVTDDNGNVVIVATHSFKTQHFIDESDS